MWGEAVTDLIENGREDDERNVTLLVGANKDTVKKFVLSRAVIRLSSEVFEELLSRDPGPSNVYEIEDVEPLIFQHIVKYMFMHSDWRFNGNLEDACSLIRAAEKYKLEELVHIICKQISDLNFEDHRLIQYSNACYIFNVLRSANYEGGEEKIWEPVLNYICKNAAHVLSEDTFLDLTSDAVVDILREDELTAQSELDIFKTALRWGLYTLQKQSRRCSIESLRQILEWPIRFIRFPNMTEFEFRHYVQPTGILTSQQERSLTDWWESRGTMQNDRSILMFSSKPRTYLQGPDKDPGGDFGDEKSRLEITRAELFQAKFRSECEHSNLNLAVEELRKELHAKSAELDAFKNKFRKELQFSLVDLMKLLKEEVGAAKADLSNQVLALEAKIDLEPEPEKSSQEVDKSTEELKGEVAKLSSRMDMLVVDTWKLYLKESQTQAQDLLEFPQTEKYACAILLKNDTTTSLLEPSSHFYYLSRTRCYEQMQSEVVPAEIAAFGFTENAYGTCGLFSYRLGERRFVVSFYVYSDNKNEFALGFVPAATPLDDQLYKGMRFADWTEKTDRKKVTCHAPHLDGTVEFGNFRVKATMKSAKKALLTVLLFNVT